MISFLRAPILAFLLCCSCSIAVAQRPQNLPKSDPVVSARYLEDGIRLETQRLWIDAIQHYETATRELPGDSELKRRLQISRLHFDVNRRISDAAIQKVIATVSPQEALDLYSDILARLETNYVEVVRMTDVVRGGTAYLEVALTEPDFIKQYAQNIAPEQVESFRTSVHRITLGKEVRDRFEARQVVVQAAQAADKQLRLSPTATIMQFVMGAVALLDPHSSFLSPSDLNDVESQIEGNFVGLGIELKPHKAPLELMGIIAGGPAEEAGLEAGDLILEIGSVVCEEAGADRAADLLRGPENSRVRLVIQKRNGETEEKMIVRRRVEVRSIEKVDLIDSASGVGYLKISSFQKTTPAELDEALWKLHGKGMQSLIIDVRGNPGGLLDAAVAVADRFISSGGIVSTRGKSGIENQNYQAHRSGTWQVPLALLIDDQSASASEILAGALRDSNRGVLIGETTYGKGSVQGLFHTKSLGCGVRLTVAKFFSPSGRAINEQGVEPIIAVKESSDNVRFVSRIPAEDNAAANRGLSSRGSGSSDRVLDVAVERAKSGMLASRPLSRN